MNRIFCSLACIGALALPLAGCGDDTGDTSGTQGTGGSTSDGGTGGTGGTGTQGTGGSTSDGGTGGTGGTTGGAGGSSSDGGAGGGSAATLNGCTAAKAVTLGDGEATITNVGLDYDPPCVKVQKGAKLTFTANPSFTAHPLVGGTVTESGATPDPASPIPATATGESVEVTFPEAGEFGFYCNFHAGAGMMGAVYVVE